MITFCALSLDVPLFFGCVSPKRKNAQHSCSFTITACEPYSVPPVFLHGPQPPPPHHPSRLFCCENQVARAIRPHLLPDGGEKGRIRPIGGKRQRECRPAGLLPGPCQSAACHEMLQRGGKKTRGGVGLGDGEQVLWEGGKNPDEQITATAAEGEMLLPSVCAH